MVVGDGDLAGQDLSPADRVRFWRRAEKLVRPGAVGYAVVVVGSVGIRHWELEARQMVSNAGYAGRQVDFGFEEASFVARSIHGETCLIHRHRRRRPYLFPCQ